MSEGTKLRWALALRLVRSCHNLSGSFYSTRDILYSSNSSFHTILFSKMHSTMALFLPQDRDYRFNKRNRLKIESQWQFELKIKLRVIFAV